MDGTGGGIDQRVLHTRPEWPDLGSVPQATKDLCEVLDIATIFSLSWTGWTAAGGGYERAKGAISQQLDDIDQNYCMSVRLLKDPFCPHYDCLERKIGSVGDSLVTFYAPANSVQRSVTPV